MSRRCAWRDQQAGRASTNWINWIVVLSKLCFGLGLVGLSATLVSCTCVMCTTPLLEVPVDDVLAVDVLHAPSDVQEDRHNQRLNVATSIRSYKVTKLQSK